MCLAYPGKVIEIKGRQAVVDYSNQTKTVLLGDENVVPGEYVLVQMGVVVKCLTPEEAQISINAWNEASALQ